MVDIPDKPQYIHGAQGTKPSAPIDYANGDAVDAEEFDYFVYEEFDKIRKIIDVLDAVDSDGDNVVDAADGASDYSNGGSTVQTHPTEVDFLDKLTVSADGSGGVQITTSALDEEEVEDAVDALITGGTNITTSYDDAAGVLTIDTHARYEDSEAIDAVNNDADHGSTAQHDYFSEDHADLTNVTEHQHHGEPVTFETGHTGWGETTDAEIHRINLQSSETFQVVRIEFSQRGGGSSTNADVDVYDETTMSVIGSADLGTVDTNPGSSDAGSDVIVRLTNNTGGAIDATIRVVGYINT